MKKAILFLALALGSLAVFAKNVVIDVRTDREYAAGHIDGAVNIDHTKIAQDIGKAGAGKDDTVIVYCQTGGRSALAQETLKKMGFLHVENYGGIDQARKLLQKP